MGKWKGTYMGRGKFVGGRGEDLEGEKEGILVGDGSVELLAKIWVNSVWVNYVCMSILA